VAKSVLELYEAETRLVGQLVSAGADASLWDAAARRHYDSAKRAIDQLVASQGDFHTEGEITFEDGMISCSALQMGMLALMQNDENLKNHYTQAMLKLLENHNCLTQLHMPDARRRGGTMRYWEAQYDVHMMPNMFNSPHGWSAWRAYATYYAYLLTGDEKWLLETWNAMGALTNLIDYKTGELRWAYVLDPYIKAKQIHEPVPGIDPDSLDFANPHPDMYPNREFVFGEGYVPMVSSWQTRNSQDNDVHEVFKCLGETFLTNAFVVEDMNGHFNGYNCTVSIRDGKLCVLPGESQIVNLHVNLKNSYEILFNGQIYNAEQGLCDFITDDVFVAAPQPYRGIFDTDMGNDIDDALALQMLFNYHQKGVVDLKGITISKSNPHAIEFVDGFCRYNGFSDIPLGYVYDGPNKDEGNYLLPTLNAEINGEKILCPQRDINSDIPKAHLVIQNLLEESPDASVILIAVGPLTNIARLLSDEGGVDLVKKKVAHVYLMSGDFSGKGAAEWNVLQDLEASRKVYSQCPVPITTVGFEAGKDVQYPAVSIMNDFGDPLKNPLCIAYYNFLKMPYDRPSWDLLAVLKAVEPSCEILHNSPAGYISVNNDGVTLFKQDADGKHKYVIMQTDNRRKAVDILVRRVNSIKQ
jgi:inosine-uridine nucleoside N-ribohydrolase